MLFAKQPMDWQMTAQDRPRKESDVKAQRSLAIGGMILALAGVLSSAGAMQITQKKIRPEALKMISKIGRPDATMWMMKATLAHTELGQEVAWKPRDRIKLEVTFKNIGDGDFPFDGAQVSFYKNGIHLDTWGIWKLAPNESKLWYEYYEFNHGEKQTFTVWIHYLNTPLESERALSNNRREIVIDEGEDTILHAGGEIFGQFTKAQ